MFGATWFLMNQEKEKQKKLRQKRKEQDDRLTRPIIIGSGLFAGFIVAVLFLIAFSIIALFYTNVYASQLSGREIAERSRGLRDMVDNAKPVPQPRVRQWLSDAIRTQQKAVEKERERRKISRRCFAISSGFCRNRVDPHYNREGLNSVQKRRVNRRRAKALNTCRKNCYKFPRPKLERRSP